MLLFEWVGKLVWWLLDSWSRTTRMPVLAAEQLCRQQHDAAEMLAVAAASAFDANPSIFHSGWTPVKPPLTLCDSCLLFLAFARCSGQRYSGAAAAAAAAVAAVAEM